MKAMKKILFSFAFFLTPFLFCGCHAPYEKNEDKLVVVTTIFPYYDFVRELKTPDIELHLLITPGMDSHSYEPTPSDLILLQNADLLIYNGGEAEVWVEEILEGIDTSELSTLCMMDYVELIEEDHGDEEDSHHHHAHEHDQEYNHDEEHDHEEEPDHEEEHDHEATGCKLDHSSGTIYDEHIWTSPKNAILITEAIKNRLCEMDESHRKEYEEKFESYRLELAALDQAFTDTIANAKNNVIVVGDKFPFQYFVTHYGLTHYAAFPACSSEVEPSVKTMITLIDVMNKEHLGTVFYMESTNNTKVAATICEETGADSLLLHSCHTVTKQELENGVTYLSLMKKNVEALQKGLNTP